MVGLLHCRCCSGCPSEPPFLAHFRVLFHGIAGMGKLYSSALCLGEQVFEVVK